MKPEFKTERLTLRPIQESDFEIFQRISSDEFVRKFLFDDEILEENQIKEFIKISDKSFAGKNYGLWLIILNEGKKEIGFTGLWHFFDENQPQLLYALLPEFTRKGFAAEAARKIIDYAFSDLSFDFIEASCDAPNLDSHRVAQKLGMEKIKEETINELPTVFFRLEK